MDGFGAALTDSSAWLLSRLPPPRREAILKELFDPKTGNGFSVVRICMGASDFAVRGSYTYDDLPAGDRDETLGKFSIAPDMAYIVPVLRDICRINPQVKIIATPWTAPAWMKTSKNLHGGWLDWPAYAVYARYFVAFLQAYKAAGIPIWAVTVQNEPRHETDKYPSMRMEPGDQARFVRDHLGPAFAAARLQTKIFVWDHNWDAPDYPIAVLSDSAARPFIAGAAFHSYAGSPDAQQKFRTAFPDKEIHFTESSGGDFAPDFGANLYWDIENLICGATRYGAKSVLKWNIALDEKHGPQNGGCTDCRGVVTIHSKTGEITRNEEFYALGHASRYVRPNAVYLPTSPVPDLPSAAFRNPDGSLIWVACNGGAARTIHLRTPTDTLSIVLPARAAITVKW